MQTRRIDSISRIRELSSIQSTGMPEDIWLEIMLILDPASIIGLMQVNKHLYSTLNKSLNLLSTNQISVNFHALRSEYLSINQQMNALRPSLVSSFSQKFIPIDGSENTRAETYSDNLSGIFGMIAATTTIVILPLFIASRITSIAIEEIQHSGPDAVAISFIWMMHLLKSARSIDQNEGSRQSIQTALSSIGALAFFISMYVSFGPGEKFADLIVNHILEAAKFNKKNEVKMGLLRQQQKNITAKLNKTIEKQLDTVKTTLNEARKRSSISFFNIDDSHDNKARQLQAFSASRNVM